MNGPMISKVIERVSKRIVAIVTRMRKAEGKMRTHAVSNTEDFDKVRTKFIEHKADIRDLEDRVARLEGFHE